MKEILIILNGALGPEVKRISKSLYKKIVCADGAIEKVIAYADQIDAIFGDLDSILTKINNIPHINLENQEYTDFEKILIEFKQKGITQFDVIGGSGEEQDHFMGHISIALKYVDDLKITFFDSRQMYYVTNQNQKISNIKGKVVSIIPLPIATGITYKGLKYPLKNETLTFGERIGTRNVAVDDTVEIELKSGCIALFKEI